MPPSSNRPEGDLGGVSPAIDRRADRLVSTPRGPARLLVSAPPPSASRRAWLALGHGAGGGPDAPDLLALATELPGHGIGVVRVEQPWRLAGRRVAAPPPHLDQAWLVALAALRDGEGAGLPLLVGGRSAGARVACRTSVGVGALGVLALAFPLHPPGRPERSRAEELAVPLRAGLPCLLVQGERDPFGRPEEVRATGLGVPMVVVPGAGHALTASTAPATPAAPAVPGLVVSAVLGWARRLTDTSRH